MNDDAQRISKSIEDKKRQYVNSHSFYDDPKTYNRQEVGRIKFQLDLVDADWSVLAIETLKVRDPKTGNLLEGIFVVSASNKGQEILVH